jgi:hypothetical protein
MLIDHFLLTNMSIVLRFVNNGKPRMGNTSHIPASNVKVQYFHDKQNKNTVDYRLKCRILWKDNKNLLSGASHFQSFLPNYIPNSKSKIE